MRVIGARKLMSWRFGVEVTGVCRICGTKGPTEMHHIISASRIAKMDRVDLERLYAGVRIRRGFKESGHRMDEQRLRKFIIESLPNNIIELCIPCHRNTDSHRYRQWSEDLEAGRDPMKKTKRRKKAVRMKFQGRFRCSGTTKRGTSCRYRVEVEGGYCQYHEP